MAVAAGFRTGNGICFVGSGEVWEQNLSPWKKARVRLQQYRRDAGSRGGLCAVICSTSGRGNQFARRKVKGMGPKPVDKPSKKDVHLVQELQNFVMEHNLPLNQLPSIKELMSRGRLDLANAVRSRGYKAVSRMLANSKVPSRMSSSSSCSSDSEVAVGGKLSAEGVLLDSNANLLAEEPAALDSVGDGVASQEAEGTGASSLAFLSNGALAQQPVASTQEDPAVSSENVGGGQTDLIPVPKIVEEDVTSVRGVFSNARLAPTSPQDEEADTRVQPSQRAGTLEEKLARLKEAVSEVSLKERARMYVKTGEWSLLQEWSSTGPANGSSSPVEEPGKLAGQGRLVEMDAMSKIADRLSNARASILRSAELLASDARDSAFKEGDNKKATFPNDVSAQEPSEPLRTSPILLNGKAVAPLQESRPAPDLQLDDDLLDSDFEDSDDEFLEDSDEEFPKLPEITTNKASNGALRHKSALGGDELDAEEGIAADEEMEQILTILAKQREIGRLMQRDKDLDSQFHLDAQVELDKIKSVLQFREAKTATLRQALQDAHAELSLVKSKAAADMKEAAQMLAEKDAILKGTQLALARLKKVSLEWWGEGTKVELAGNFNGWQHFFAFEPDLSSEIPNFDGSKGPMLWYLDIWLYPGVYEIKFIVDGIWTLDHRREMAMRSPNMHNNILRVDA